MRFGGTPWRSIGAGSRPLVAVAAAAELFRVDVEELFPEAARRQAEMVVVTRNWREVEHGCDAAPRPVASVEPSSSATVPEREPLLG